MLFNSFAFAVFLPIVFILYYILPHKYRWVLLLIASYYFYMSWNVKYVVLILFTTISSYSAAILMEKYNNKKSQNLILTITAVVCLGILFFFKYFNFVSSSIATFASLFAIELEPVTLNLLLPVGISFYTFQTLSYVVDVYKGSVKPEHHFGYYATFISFFPQLVAGPIERTENLLPQIKSKHKFNYENATYGLKLMAWGYFKKIVIADTLSQWVSIVYDAPQGFKGFALILATIFFTLQIYCDFSGYSDIAIGTAKLMGINLMTNFKSPYFSQSIKEFWSRWHISLSTWFRDYVYIPLGGNRCSKIRHYFNLMVTFLASGLWHGANWTYVVWGGLHGLGQVLENAIFGKVKQSRNFLIKWIRILLIFIFVAFAWIFFVSNSISDAFYIISNIFVGIRNPISYLHIGFSNLGLGKQEFIFTTFSLIILFIFDYMSLTEDVIIKISNTRESLRWIIYITFILWIIFNIPVVNSSEFIYFQF